MSGIQQYKTVAKFFRERAFANSSSPYDDICENYRELMGLLNEYEPIKGNEKIDYMRMAIDTILSYMKYGFNHCHNWLPEDFSDHFCEVNRYITYWEGVLIEKSGYNFDK